MNPFLAVEENLYPTVTELGITIFNPNAVCTHLHRTRQVIQRLRVFNAAPQNWNDINSPANMTNLPFPSIIPVPGIPLSPDFEFSYIGRQKGAELEDLVLSLQSSSRKVFLGNKGSGKSFMVAKLVVLLSNLALNRRVVYLADCQHAVTGCFENYLLSAFHIAFPNEFDDRIFNASEEHIRLYLKHFITAISRIHQVIYMIDGWDFFDVSSDPSAIQARYFLMKIMDSGIVIRVTSTSCPQYHDNETDSIIPLYGGLSWFEWMHWRTRFPFNALAINNEDDHMIEHITGFIPLILRRLASYTPAQMKVIGVPTLQDRITYYCTDVDRFNFGGGWVGNSFEDHIRPIVDRRNTESKYLITMMEEALIGEHCTNYQPRLLDHRFFYYDASKNRVIVICGLIKEFISKFLEKQEQGVYRHSYLSQCETNNWYRLAYRSSTDNPVIRNFYFKKHVVSKILMNLYRTNNNSWDRIHIHHFYRNFPHISEIHQIKGTIDVYLPVKFNLRYIDLVIRRFEGGRVYLEYIHISLEAPFNHADSLNFLTTRHNEEGNNLTDRLRYFADTEFTPGQNNTQIHEMFRWETCRGHPPRSYAIPSLPTPPITDPNFDRLTQRVNIHSAGVW